MITAAKSLRPREVTHSQDSGVFGDRFLLTTLSTPTPTPHSTARPDSGGARTLPGRPSTSLSLGFPVRVLAMAAAVLRRWCGGHQTPVLTVLSPRGPHRRQALAAGGRRRRQCAGWGVPSQASGEPVSAEGPQGLSVLALPARTRGGDPWGSRGSRPCFALCLLSGSV